MAANNIGIYLLDVSASVIKYHLSQIVGSLSEQWTYYHDSTLFKSSCHDRRVAIFQIPYPVDNTVQDAIDDIYDYADSILVICSEIHMKIVESMRTYDREKITYFNNGFLNPNLLRAKTFTFFDWFITTVHFYKNVKPSMMLSLEPHKIKPLMFDALLGRKKNHRDQAYDFILSNDLESKGIITYINEYQRNIKPLGEGNNDSRWIWPDGDIDKDQSIEWTVNRVDYYGHRMSLSQIIPVNVYNQTAYSLVCETNYEDDYVFFTEKTVKPILARRLFILIGNRYSLLRLRDLGFRTFNGIIDESYDEIEGWKSRGEAALEQLRWLCLQDQDKILEKCRDIVMHNYDLMYGKDWYREFSFPFRKSLFNR